jgi:PLP dependent protein
VSEDAAAIAVRLAGIRARIERAAVRAGRAPGEVGLVAVSKTRPADAVVAAIAAGVTDVGENYAQELVAKHAAVSAPVRWHFIGQLQTNKVKLVIGRVALIHAVDSRALLDAIARRALAAGIVQPVLLAVSAAGEARKSGVDPGAVAELAAVAAGLPGVRLEGLMTMPPDAADPEVARPFFRRLRELRDRLATAACPLPILSMGMSGDFEVAVEEGATLVRIGTSIFGPRESGAH